MIVELIGLPGTGKSTLSRALSGRIDRVQLEPPPNLKKAKDIPFFIRNSFFMVPSLSRICLLEDGKFPSRDELASMVILNGWHRVLCQKELKNNKIFILDQGPVYMLMHIIRFGSKRLKPSNMMKWWNYSLRHWAATLDMVIWLDTSLPDLIERIRTREVWHGVKDKSGADAYQYLESYRQAFESVISSLKACPNTFKLLHLDTGRYSLDETVEQVINALCLENYIGLPRNANELVSEQEENIA